MQQPRSGCPQASSGRYDDPTGTVSHPPSINSAPRGAQLRREESRRALEDRVGTAKLPHLSFQLGQPLGVTGHGTRPVTAVDLGLGHPVPQRSRLIPYCCPIRATPQSASPDHASTANRIARCRISSGYFLGAATTLILSGVESLHQARHGTERRPDERPNITRPCRRAAMMMPSSPITWIVSAVASYWEPYLTCVWTLRELACQAPGGRALLGSGHELGGVGGVRLYYERRGDGPSVLFISGASGDAGHWTGVADVLATQYTVVAYDRRGTHVALDPRVGPRQRSRSRPTMPQGCWKHWISLLRSCLAPAQLPASWPA